MGSLVALEALERSALLTRTPAVAPTGTCARPSWPWSSGTPWPRPDSGSRSEARSLGPRSRGRLRLLDETLGPRREPAGVAAKVDELIALADHMAAQGDADLALRFAHLAALQTWVTDVGQELRSEVLAAAERVSPSEDDPLLLSVYSLTDPNGHNTELIERA